MLAHKYVPGKQSIAGWLASEKLDGMRVFWDGGITRGMYKRDVPFANNAKDERYVLPQKATGLWSRYGNVIHAPDFFLDQLPDYMLDGELYLGRQQFQELEKIVKTLEPGPRWKDVTFKVFDSPDSSYVFLDGTINSPNFKKDFNGIWQWYTHTVGGSIKRPTTVVGYENTYYALKKQISGPNVCVLEQERLPFHGRRSVERLEEMLETIVAEGGEGVILRRATSLWLPNRIHDLLKYKPYNDTEGTVIGYSWGRETDKGSKLLGLMGSLRVAWKGVEFDLSGFKDEERIMAANVSAEEFANNPNVFSLQTSAARTYGAEHPGEVVGNNYYNPKFKRGSIITFRYRELTDDGIPKEARYLRKHNAT